MRLSIYLLVVVLLATPAAARDIFVNNLSGNDTLTGRTPTSVGRESGPVLTIAKAARLATPGDRIVLVDTGEPYREQVSLQGGPRSGVSANRPLIFDGGGAVIDGSIPVPDQAWEHVEGDIFRFAPDIKSHQVLLSEVALVRAPLQRGAPLPKLAPLEWCLSNGMIYLRVRHGELPQQYHASCAGMWTGITIYDVRDVIVQNVVVQGFALDGVNAHDNAFNVQLEGITALSNGRSGISVGGASRVRLVGCEATGNHTAQLRTEGYCRVRHSDCTFDATAAQAIEKTGGEIEAE